MIKNNQQLYNKLSYHGKLALGLLEQFQKNIPCGELAKMFNDYLKLVENHNIALQIKTVFTKKIIMEILKYIHPDKCKENVYNMVIHRITQWKQYF
jgi:predicted DNA-binding protein (UPF0278 family)